MLHIAKSVYLNALVKVAQGIWRMPSYKQAPHTSTLLRYRGGAFASLRSFVVLAILSLRSNGEWTNGQSRLIVVLILALVKVFLKGVPLFNIYGFSVAHFVSR